MRRNEIDQSLTMRDYPDHLSVQVQERAICVTEGMDRVLEVVQQLLEAELCENPQFSALQAAIAEMGSRAVRGMDLYLPRGHSKAAEDTKK